MSDGSAILMTAVGTIAGAALGALANWYFSRRSSSELDATFRSLAGNDQKLLRAVNTIGRMLEKAGIAKLAYDEAGNVTSIVITGSGRITLPGLRVRGTGTYSPPPQYDRQHEQPPSPEPEGDHA